MVTGLKFEIYPYSQFCNLLKKLRKWHEIFLLLCCRKHPMMMSLPICHNFKEYFIFVMGNNHGNRVANGEPSYKIMFLVIKSCLQINWILIQHIIEQYSVCLVNTPFSSFIPFMYLSKLNSCSLEF